MRKAVDGGLALRVCRALALALFACAVSPSQAQTARQIARIGVLSPFARADDAFLKGLEQRLAELGYKAGRDIALEYRSSGGRADLLPRLAGEIAALRVSAIVTTTAPGAQAAKQASSTIPIVIAGVDDAVEQGFVGTLARPGGNITGISWLNTELSAKRVELLKRTLPQAGRIAYVREAVGGASALRSVERAARALDMRLVTMELRAPHEIDGVFSALAQDRVAAVVLAQGSMIAGEEAHIVELAARFRLPTVFPSRSAVEAGGLMSYGPRPLALYRRAADYVDRILKGARPAELPVEQPTSFELVVNAGTAKAMGITLPYPVLVSTDEMIP